jgi:hypothetical protein
MVNPLSDELADWNDWDGASYSLAISLGIMDKAKTPYMSAAKHVFWSDNPLGNMLHQTLEELVKLGFVEKNEEDQYRWNKEFKWQDKY